MRLAHYQIEHIKEYIDHQNIWYKDIKDELLDHIICAVEEEMEHNDTKFVDALAKVILEVKPKALQRAKLKTEHLRTFKSVYQEFSTVLQTKPYQIVLAIAFAACIILTSGSLDDTLRIYHMLGLVALFFNFFIRTWGNMKFQPLHNTLFMSRLNATYTPALLITSLVSLLLSDWLQQAPLALLIYISLFNCYILACFHLLNRSFVELKKYGTTQ